MDAHSQAHEPASGRNVGRWVFWGFALVAGYFLYTEHRAHLAAVLPYLLLAACPLMHMFHHHGSHRHGSNTGEGDRAKPGGDQDDTGSRKHPDHHH